VKGAIPFIKKAVAHGMVIGIGHTHATEEVIEEAVSGWSPSLLHLGMQPQAPLSSSETNPKTAGHGSIDGEHHRRWDSPPS